MGYGPKKDWTENGEILCLQMWLTLASLASGLLAWVTLVDLWFALILRALMTLSELCPLALELVQDTRASLPKSPLLGTGSPMELEKSFKCAIKNKTNASNVVLNKLI